MSGSSSIAAGRSSSVGLFRPRLQVRAAHRPVLADLVDGIEPDGPFRRLADLVTEVAATSGVAAFKKLSIFFPMWNEEAYLGRALGAAHEACESLLAWTRSATTS